MTRNPSDGGPGSGVVARTPFGSDGDALAAVLTEAGIPFVLCRSGAELRRVLCVDTAALLLSQEALDPDTVAAVGDFGARQPDWSALPILLLLDPGFGMGVSWPNMSRLDRPVSKEMLIDVLRLALASRARQFTIRDLLAELRGANERLEERVEMRTAELRRYSERLEREIAMREQAQAVLRQAHLRLAERQEQDRLQMARELHDDIVQRLLALNLTLTRTIRGSEPTIEVEQLDAYRQEVLATSDALRRLIRELRPAGLEFGIGAALEELVRTLGQRYELRIPIELHTDLEPQPSPDVTLCLYRSAQELLRNSLRHAEAERIELRLSGGDDRVVLQVSDDGVGFAPPDRLARLVSDDHFGLVGVEEHVGALGGRVEIRSAPGRGTTVTVELPL